QRQDRWLLTKAPRPGDRFQRREEGDAERVDEGGPLRVAMAEVSVLVGENRRELVHPQSTDGRKTDLKGSPSPEDDAKESDRHADPDAWLRRENDHVGRLSAQRIGRPLAEIPEEWVVVGGDGESDR